MLPKAEYGQYAKSYPSAKKIQLPPPIMEGMSLEKALRARRSLRKFAPIPLTLAQTSQILFAAAGKTGEARERDLRTVPSAGARYPMETYLMVNRVEGLPVGLYHYSVSDHSLEVLAEEDLVPGLFRAPEDTSQLHSAGILIIMTAVTERCRSRYKDRFDRYIAMEAGHMSQNIYLEAASLGLGSYSIGAIDEGRFNGTLELDAVVESSLYMQPVGALPKN